MDINDKSRHKTFSIGGHANKGFFRGEMRNMVFYYEALTEVNNYLWVEVRGSERKETGTVKEYDVRGYTPTGVYELNVNSEGGLAFGWLHKDDNGLYQIYQSRGPQLQKELSFSGLT